MRIFDKCDLALCTSKFLLGSGAETRDEMSGVESSAKARSPSVDRSCEGRTYARMTVAVSNHMFIPAL
jgi:hypothetical protein